MRVADALVGVTRLGLDTAPIIYYVEAHPKYGVRVDPIFQRIADGRLLAVTSIITLTETLVHPIAHGNTHLGQEYRRLLTRGRNLRLQRITLGIAESAAELRARYRLRTPDALQIATAVASGCEAFFTNDVQLARITELRVLVVDQLTP